MVSPLAESSSPPAPSMIGHHGGMRIVGRARDGTTLSEFDLGHGEDPTEQLAIRGLRILEPVDAFGSDDSLTVTWQVEPDPGIAVTIRPAEVEESELTDVSQAVRRQRVAAYAWVESSRGILASEFYRPVPGGRWGLPGGGIDPGEEPSDAVHREVMEETSQKIELGGLAGVDTRRRIGRSLTGEIEDFHAVRIIYRATCPDPTDPVVIDVGGTTTAAAWFAYDTWSDQSWNTAWLEVIRRLVGE